MIELNFYSLPYTCQKRFAEVAEIKIIVEFSKVSSYTKQLCKNRKIVQQLEYAPSKLIPKDADSYLINDIKDLQKWKTIEIIDKFKICFDNLQGENEKAGPEIVYQFEDFKMIPRNYERLDLYNVVFENIYDVTELIGPNLIEFSYLPKFITWEFSGTWKSELNDLLSALDKVEIVRLVIIFNREETEKEFQECDELLQKWMKQRKRKIPSSRENFWQISWNHGHNLMQAKIYRKTNLKSQLKIPNGKTSYNFNSQNDFYRYRNIFEEVHIHNGF